MAELIYTIDNRNVSEFKAGFLKYRPVPMDAEGNPIMSENKWIKEWGRRQFTDSYQKGKQMLAAQATLIEKDIIK